MKPDYRLTSSPEVIFRWGEWSGWDTWECSGLTFFNDDVDFLVTHKVLEEVTDHGENRGH